MGDAKRIDEMMRDAANDLAMPQPSPQALAYAQQMLRIGAASIEVARASPPWLSSGSPPAGLRDLANEVMDRLADRHEIGPSRAARLVAYRCAALPSVLDVPLASFSNGETPVDVAENIAHAMLAAEREPQS